MSSSQLARGGSTYSLSLRSAAWLCHTSQVLTRDPRLTLKGCEQLLCVLSTCNGDDFAVCTADTGSLRLVFDLLCRMDADPTLVRDATAARGKGGIALYHSAQVQVAWRAHSHPYPDYQLLRGSISNPARHLYRRVANAPERKHSLPIWTTWC